MKDTFLENFYKIINLTNFKTVAATIQKRSINFDIEFRVNRPFLFMILESKSNLVMFMGRIYKPVEVTSENASKLNRDEL